MSELLLVLLLAPSMGRAAGTADNSVQPEKVDVDALKKKYWAKGDSSEMQVVQNRLYSKAQRFELGLFGGFASADPFLSIKNWGGSVGYHFTEYFGFNLLAWSYLVGDSSANTDFQQETKGTTLPDTNRPKNFYGAEVVWSPIYGKLSIMGATIIYYDFHVLGGGGILNTESGNDAAFHLGAGQQVYLSKDFALKLDYRIMRNSETLLSKSPQTFGAKTLNRVNYSDIFTIGVSLLI